MACDRTKYLAGEIYGNTYLYLTYETVVNFANNNKRRSDIHTYDKRLSISVHIASNMTFWRPNNAISWLLHLSVLSSCCRWQAGGHLPTHGGMSISSPTVTNITGLTCVWLQHPRQLLPVTGRRSSSHTWWYVNHNINCNRCDLCVTSASSAAVVGDRQEAIFPHTVACQSHHQLSPI